MIFKFDDIYRGIIIVYPHGDYLVEGIKKVIIKSKKYMDCINKPLLLIQDKKALGVIMIDYVDSIDLQEFDKKFKLHRITEEERKKWWKNKKILYEYDVTYIHIFRNPIHINYLQGAQTFIKPANITMMQNIYVGTSGYDYGWFDVKHADALKYYSTQYNSLELNSSFYKTPTENQCKKLFDETPTNFKFSIKINKYITHYGKLENTYVMKFMDSLKILMPKIKCILFQFPSHFKYTDKNMKKLEDLTYHQAHVYFAFEFRSITWYNDSVLSFFKKRKAWTIVLAYNCEGLGDMKKGYNFNLNKFVFTSDFLYIRMHGTTGKYEGSHKKYIVKLVDFIRKSYDDGVVDVFTYFNNTDSMNKKYKIPDALYDANYMNKYLFY